MHLSEVKVTKIADYDIAEIYKVIPDSLFDKIKPGFTVLLKPNWIKESHLYKKNEWESVITHPAVITAVVKKIIKQLNRKGKIIITDGPETASSFKKILAHYPFELWGKLCLEDDIILEIIDLREDEWQSDGNVVIKRKKLSGDPRGSVEINLSQNQSEFYNHKKSKKGYFGADSDIIETNKAHDGEKNIYRVSRTVIEADVFVNLPKLKTHKKAGITCCLKNLVGINTYKNFLPHYSLGSHKGGGDQFPDEMISSKIEGGIMPIIHQNILLNPKLARVISPLIQLSKKIFGSNENTIRGGSWSGNDTIWRMILDLNKILFYGKSDNRMLSNNWSNAKNYIGVVDAIIAGEGNGPKSPDPIKMGYLIWGENPVAIDAVCARLMGFDPFKIPSIINAFKIKEFKLAPFTYKEINVIFDSESFLINDLPQQKIILCKPHFGWKGNIEFNRNP